ncbi:dockerin type I domain-containing protein [Blastopirellula retiformator]|uniref:EF-hand domain-containing protein n=1 Tax=Blastopirellula retiformator TaxID=2527970 RepID=A0A5C5VLH7_9BACT|nr:dockerin type I domain-containing protein [Blastopirellula retiformator]TWT38582.1 hypothetical protein Enr8_02750 [Blastopirellula retiformator]
MSKKHQRTDRAHALRSRRPYTLHAEQLEARQLLAADLLPQADLLEGELTLEVAVDDDALVYAAGSKATNSGTFAGAVNLSASIGNVEDNGDGTWTWTLDDVQVSDTQTVTITAEDGALGMEEVSFELSVESVDFELLFDTETELEHNGISQFVWVGDVGYFVAYPSQYPISLWQTDGTPGGTTRIESTYGGGTIENLTSFNGELYFLRSSGSLEYQSFELWKYDETLAQTVLVYDFTPHESPFYFAEMVVAGDLLYLNVGEATHGQELWVTDGTTAGTQLVADINPGVGNSEITDLTPTDNYLFFVANDGVHGDEVWKTDGTMEGTVMVTDIFAVDDFFSPNDLTAVGNDVYFLAENSVIWKYDGDTAETARLTTITDDGEIVLSGHFLRSIDSQLYFYDNDQIWTSDGTPEGTKAITDIPALGVSTLVAGVKVDGDLYFVRRSYLNGDALFKTNEVTGETTQLASFKGGTFDENPLFKAGGAVYFRGYDPTFGTQLWRTDGTKEGTTRISDFTGQTSLPFDGGDDSMLFLQGNTAQYGTEPYFVTIDSPPTIVLRPIQIGEDNQSVILSALGTYDLLDALSELHFDWDLDGDGQYDDASGLTASISFADLATAGVANISLRVIDTDGKIATRKLVIDSNDPILMVDEIDGLIVTEGETAANTGRVAHVLGSDVQLSASIGEVVDTGDGTWSWSYTTLDGPDETQTVTITAVVGGGQSSVSFPLVVNNERPLYIGIHSPGAVLQGETAFMSGTWSDVEADTVTVTSSLGDFTVLEDGTWTWSYDTTGLNPGNYQSNILVRDEVSGSQYSVRFSVAAPLTADQPYVTTPSGLMAANSGTIGNGGEATVTLNASLGDVIDNGDGTWSWSFDTRRTNVGSQEVTITSTYENGVETSTTFQLAVHNLSYEFYDLRPGPAGSYPSSFQQLGDYVYFLAEIRGYQTHLFRTDAVSAPQQISGGLENPAVYNVAQLLLVNDTLYFLANDAEGIASIWKTDGASGQIEKVADVPSEPGVALPSGQMAYANGYIYLGAFEELTGRELWRVNVDSGQVEMVADISPGEDDSRFYRMFSVGDVVYFFPESSPNNLWRTDGTAEGTYQVATPLSADIRYFSEFNGERYFVTDAGAISTLWRIEESGPTPIFQGAPGLFNDWRGAIYDDGDHLLFSMSRTSDAGPVWRWNETTEEMELVAELGELGFDRITGIVEYDGQLYLRDSAFQTPEDGQPSRLVYDLWVTDGTPAGTERLVGESELTGFDVTNFYVTNQGLLLFVDNDLYGHDLWKSDGTKAGTYPLLLPEPLYNLAIGPDIALGQRLIKTLGTSPDYGTELYYFQAGPVVEISGPATGLIGETVQLDAGGTYDAIDAQEDLIFAWDIDGDGQYDDASGLIQALPLTTPGQKRIGLRVTDQEGTTTYATTTILVNATPTVGVDNQTVVIGEGGVATNTGVYADPPADAVTLIASIGEIIDNLDGTWSWSNPVQDGPNEQTVTITATDIHGETDSLQFQVNIQNVAPTLTVDSAQLEVDATLSVVNAGTYGDPGQDPVLLTASLGDIIDNGDGTWSWSYASTLADVGVYDVTITATDDDGGETQVHFSLDVLALPEAGLTLNDDAAATDANGEATALPTSLTLIDEWDRFMANVWVKRPERLSGSLTSVTLDLHFNSQWFQLANFAASSGVGQLEVNNTGDVLQISASQFAEENAALDGYLLLGSFRFHPTPDGGLPNDLEGAYPQPLDPQLAITDLLVSSSDVEEQFGLQTVAPETKLQVVPFDLDDDGEINLTDLSRLIRRIGSSVATTPESYPYDFNRNGVVALTDLAHMIRNIGRTRDNGLPVAFPPTFEQPSASLSLVEPEPVTAALTSELEGERIAWSAPPLVAVTTHDADAAFGTLGLLEDCWELPANEEEVEETIEEENAFSADTWRVRQLPDWALEAASIVECLADKAIDILEELEEEHPRLARALDRLKSRLEDL